MTHHSDALPTFEQRVIDIMVDENCTIREALGIVFATNMIDDKNVFDMVDFLENQVYDLDKVHMLMMIYTGQYPDYQLAGTIDNGEAKTKGSDKG